MFLLSVVYPDPIELTIGTAVFILHSDAILLLYAIISSSRDGISNIRDDKMFAVAWHTIIELTIQLWGRLGIYSY